ncbi:MAG TPA: polyphosphate kinase 1 [Aggregatilinea sp.]|uniref:polyphosphate kinase 1 n=1 Tax=Aggregatilinea sp. TaxID=2806333 RepID=UPI002C92405B|nr:polyphosphate kinase 1 [Aggregatilinea sp.]HML20094.1 polyphosphate kinase 1 [Aggregatilinea sp.]
MVDKQEVFSEIDPQVNDTVDLRDPSLYINRELSILEFNYRVLEEALDTQAPLLERVKFLAIFANNLDEFFMIRVSGLREQVAAGVIETPADGLTPAQQLVAIRRRLLPMLESQDRCFHEDVLPQLEAHDIFIHRYADLSDERKTALGYYFDSEVFPVLTPLAVDPGRPFPHISNLSLNLAVLLRDEQGQERFARLKVPPALPRLIPIHEISQRYQGKPEPKNKRFVFLEEVIAANLHRLFPGMTLLDSYPFRVTRNADMEIEEDEASDLLETIEAGVRQRRFGRVVRLEVEADMPANVLELLKGYLNIERSDIYQVWGPLGMSQLFELADVDAPELKFVPFVPQRPAVFNQNDDIFSLLRNQDVLLHHPYDSFMPVVEFIRRAAYDPKVLAIKITLYRVGSNSPIVNALLEAQENGKQVAVLVELKARFDEENNIVWARKLEAQGVHVVYGLVGLKTHCKIALVVRREDDGLRRYVHLSTGNYNATTARIYTDMGFLSSREELGVDASEVFNRLTGYAPAAAYHELMVAPEYLRDEFDYLIRREIQHAKENRGGHMILKMNALVDPKLIRRIYEASMAGVKVDLLVRGICCLRPGLKDISDNVRVTSIVGRFLEHSRIYYFANGGEPEIFMGSADLMPRNLDRRVETIFPVEDPALKARLVDEILAIQIADNVKSRELQADGTYKRLAPGEDTPINSQQWFMEQARITS